MGTRGLTKVIYKEETKVAQYGQWDHYPEGQGLTVLEFLSINGNVEKLKAVLELVRFATEQDEQDYKDFMDSFAKGKRFITTEEADKRDAKFPLLSRDHGADILNRLLEISEPIWLRDASDFAEDELFCEGVFTVNLDTGIYTVECGDKKAFDINNLPTKEEFLVKFKEEEE